MKLNKKVASIIINYEDLECVRLVGPEAIIFQNKITELLSGYYAAVSAGIIPNTIGDLTEFDDNFNFETIRNPIQDIDIRNS